MDILDNFDILEALDTIKPVIIFLVLVFFANLTDKKKPPVKKRDTSPLPEDEPFPDIERPTDVIVKIPPLRKKPDILVEEADKRAAQPEPPAEKIEEKPSAYQVALRKKLNETPKKKHGHEDKAQETVAEPVQQVRRGLANVNVVQAIIAAEVLGRPKALQRRRR